MSSCTGFDRGELSDATFLHDGLIATKPRAALGMLLRVNSCFPVSRSGLNELRKISMDLACGSGSVPALVNAFVKC